MKKNQWFRWMPAVAAVAAFALGGGARAAAAPDLNGQIGIRPLTPQEIKDYSLTGLQRSGGLSTVGVGQPVHLEAMVNIDVPAADITNISWSLVQKPFGSAATLTNSPLGSNVPLYKGTDRQVLQLAGRSFLRPDREGQYTVTATIQSASSGTVTVTQQVTAATYLGADTCRLCHSGGDIAPNTYGPWSQTAHAVAFTNAVDGWSTDHFSQNCVSCHVVGFDTHPLANNGGFDDYAATNGWTLPAHAEPGNFAAMPEALRKRANVQCENCHGPGSEHAYSLGETHLTSVSLSAGTCSQCHDSLSHHYKSAEWNNSRHAVAVEETEASCARCHTAQGFIDFVKGAPAVAVPYEGITCATCHDPHDGGEDHQLRAIESVTLANGDVLTHGGAGKVCMTCHMTRRDADSYVENNSGSSRFGPHNASQADMLAGVNAITYGKVIPSSAHASVVKNSCTTCHMQSVASTNGAFTHAGGHTFSMKWDAGTANDLADDVHLVDTCVQCHGPVDSFDFARQDYDGDGEVEGVQTEVKGLMNRLAMLLPPVGQPTVSITASYTKQQLRAAYNYKFVEVDGSYGVHNLSYTVGLLKASIADLTDDFDQDGLSDTWEKAQFGSITAQNGSGDSDNDGVSNSLELAAGTNPNLADSDGDGVNDWAELQAGSDPMNAADKPGLVVKMFTAGEIEFASELGKTYQIHMVSELNSGWYNVSTNIPGTGGMISRLISTRNGGAKAFYRVVEVATP